MPEPGHDPVLKLTADASTPPPRASTQRLAFWVLFGITTFLGSLCGVFVHESLTEGPYPTAETEYEKVGFDSSDCWWSPEASDVEWRLLWWWFGTPPVLMGSAAAGAKIAGRRRHSSQPAGGKPLPLWAGMAMAGPAGLAGGFISTATLYGLDIRRVLDAGCVVSPTPTTSQAVIIIGAVIAATAALGSRLGRSAPSPKALVVREKVR